MARYYNVSPDDIKNSMAQQGGDANISNNLRTRKAIEAMFEHAKITDGEWVDENQPQPAPEKEEEKEEKEKGKSKKAKSEKPKAEEKSEAKETKKKSEKKEKKS
jgi:hypothetical protein